MLEEQLNTNAVSSPLKEHHHIIPTEEDKENQALSNDIIFEQDEFLEPKFSAAQVENEINKAQLKIQQEKDTNRIELKNQVSNLEQQVECLTNEKELQANQIQKLQTHLKEIINDHERTLNGTMMQEEQNIQLLVASFEKEKNLKEKLFQQFKLQEKEFIKSRERIDQLTKQIEKYQKNETVLAQTITHFETRSSLKNHQKQQENERIKTHLEIKFSKEIDLLKEQLIQQEQDKNNLSTNFQNLQEKYENLQNQTKSFLKLQKQAELLENKFKFQNEAFLTEKQVLQSKLDQVQKADTLLRSKMKSQQEQIELLTKEKQILLEEKQELTKIANDLMEIAEKKTIESQLQRRRLSMEGGNLDHNHSHTGSNKKNKKNKKRMRHSLPH